LRWANLSAKEFQKLGEGIYEALHMHGFDVETHCYVNAIREMIMEEIPFTMNRTMIIDKLEKFLQQAQGLVFVGTKQFDRQIVSEIVAFVLVYTDTIM
jgi:hypothetical protein